ncbi:hypothetical protein HWQ46_13110 [Shewanella sp. D64]|uniref:hypothetical protein n=1 Tax=unclassified Shewanella TaxID=196818 RepID=UPI0022BA39EC|nr:MULTISPECIES: hypothetical protein [unclassified Shewanella]MEC4726489.1 hypothetical protein [Shewanella sp. D64]MEC4737470.1 hypothetical protein [Shewanella sp. E94]WBJ97282.1 hypothetical protein HWQ47_09385 [Shewanella sp. MTB7]
MARSKEKSSTFSIVVILLLSVAVFTLASLYLDTRHKNNLLLLEVERLEGTQVLLMVPDEQAEVVAKWMSENPDATKTILTQAKPKQEVKVSVGPGTDEKEDNAYSIDYIDQINILTKKVEMLEKIRANSIGNRLIERDTEEYIPINISVRPSESPDINVIKNDKKINVKHYSKAHTVSESADGVKVIVLPHGGIRVTTRELD